MFGLERVDVFDGGCWSGCCSRVCERGFLVNRMFD